MSNKLFCLPIIKAGAVYKEALPSSASAATELIPLRDISDYLKANYVQEYSTVFINGISYPTNVYVPGAEIDDHAYVVVDSNLLPTDSVDDFDENYEVYDSRLDQVKSHQIAAIGASCGWTESLFATTRLDVTHSFIRPRLLKKSVDRQGYLRDADKSRTYSFDDIAAEPRVVLLGPPGCGKTTFVRRLAIHFAERAYKHENAAVPVYVQLRHYDSRQGLHGFLPLILGSSDPQKVPVKLAWVFDGFDEISTSERDNAKEAISRIVKQKSSDSFFMCSRASSYDGFLQAECNHYELQPFNWSEISQWVHQQLQDQPHDTWRTLLHSLGSVPDVTSIASNPLLLSVLTHNFQYSSVVPQQRAELLERFVDTLCETWDSVRGVSRKISRDIAPYRRSAILAWIAFEMKIHGVNSLKSDELDRWRLRYAPVANGPGAKSLLEELAQDTGLIVYSAYYDRWSFSHQLFCDYLAARHLISRTEDVSFWLDQQASIDSWQDVWVLACAITHDASHLIKGVLETDNVNEDIRAILLSGALAQGVEIDDKLLANCREIILKSFVRHAKNIEKATHLVEASDGSRAILTIDPDNDLAPSQARAEALVFMRKLLALLYRARWWKAGKFITTDIGEVAGRVGAIVADLLLRDGTIRESSGDPQSLPEAKGADAILEVDEQLWGE